jgi:protein-disulfide isomerase
MTSGKQARRQRQQAVARPPVRSTEGRKASPKVVIGALVALAVIAAVVAVVLVMAGGNGSSSASNAGTVLPDANVIAQQFRGIPQRGNVLGRANAPVTMVEYIDLQCPICREFETGSFPSILKNYVRTGKLKVIARPIVVIGPDSERGRRGMIAAEQQNRGFNFSQLLYFNQGTENTGWLDDQMVTDAAASIPGVDVAALNSATNSKAVSDRAATIDTQAQADQVAGTPTIGIGKSGGRLSFFPAGDPGYAAVSAAINQALKGSGSG